MPAGDQRLGLAVTEFIGMTTWPQRGVFAWLLPRRRSRGFSHGFEARIGAGLRNRRMA